MSRKEIKAGSVLLRKPGDGIGEWFACGGHLGKVVVKAVNNRGRLVIEGVEGTWMPAMFDLLETP